MTKAQITIFAVLAIILLFAFAFIFYIANSNSQSEFTEDKQNIDAANLAKAEIEERITSCMYEGSVKAVELLGHQGGVYYPDQVIQTKYGSITLDGFADVGEEWIIRDKNYTNYFQKREFTKYASNDVENERLYFEPFEYPCRSQVSGSLLGEDRIRDMPHCVNDYTLEKSIESISKQLNWPNLCNRNIPEGCEGDCICECSGTHCDRSVMSELEDYVSKYFEKCIMDYEVPGYNSSYREGIDNKITSYVGLSNLYFVLESQINYTTQQNDVALIFKDIKSDDIHLKLAAFFNDEFASMINKDGVVANYNLTDKLESYKSFSSLNLEVLPLYVDGEVPNKYDIMKLTLDGVDGQLKGRPFDFYFLRENRIPVLENIPKIQIPGDTRKFNITFRSADPDEDTRIILWDLMGTAEKDDEKPPVQDKYDADKKTYFFKSKLTFEKKSGSIRLNICDSMGLCDYQIILVRHNLNS